jgi:cell division protein FtsB
MGIREEIARRARDVIGPVIGLSALAYFAYHAVEGNRGLLSYFRTSQQIADARAQLEEVQAERRALEHRVGLLRSDNLDRDLLEEQARAILNYTRRDEIVLRHGGSGPMPSSPAPTITSGR